MNAMLEQKKGHPRAGANTAWVPSPTAATIHALHYHEIDVAATQKELSLRERSSVDRILNIPIELNPSWSEDEITAELENNAQGMNLNKLAPRRKMHFLFLALPEKYRPHSFCRY